ncbi:FAD-binding oxidoreductase [Calderihabitans maritimus]|uniref:FAD/FMN-containing dehydrogenases n=1 Tax=Calderihabitans maritimus TaxID=1246530 RepID=A0A1Z5HWU7_9FIRM|nr:FAD-linked oxidase C-terminal domain-containing protein [Calderihabitans maritimus]GAW93785.1 FAD/FMN-containing dehydrogenases [Calderihabitans maritimus]
MLSRRVISQLKDIFGPPNVLTSKISMEAYAYDSSPFIHYPEAVVFADKVEQISQLMKLANREKIVVVPRGAGTSLSGGAVPVHGGIILVLNRFNRILEIDPVNEVAWVESGVTNLALQQAAASYGLMFGPDPASQKVATMGGNVAEGAGGIRGVKYGVTRDHLLGLEVVLPDGEVVMIGGLGKYVPQIDLTGIFCGSEGTLGIITKILVKLIPLPEAIRTMMAVFGSLDKAGEAVSQIIARGIVPTTLEIMDQTMIRAVDDFINVGFPREAEAVLLIEVDGYEVEVDRQVESVVSICKEQGATDIRKATDEKERQDLWLARRSGNGALGRIKPAYMVQDVTVPRHKLPDMLRFVSDISKKYGIIIAQMAHAGDGNLHPHLLYDPFQPEELERVKQASHEIFTAALEMGGSLTGEHGIGMEKLEFMTQAFTANDLDFMEQVKRALDPHLVLNRGKVLDIA